MLDYCRWEFGDKQALSKFDSITAWHEAALIAMGVMDAPTKAPERESPEIPADMVPLYAHYRALRFGRCVSYDLVTLIPRNALTYAEIDAYGKLVDWLPNAEEVSVLMDIDAIFESRDLKGGK